MKGRLSDNHLMPVTVVNAPPVQEMSSHNAADSEAGPRQSQLAELETQAL